MVHQSFDDVQIHYSWQEGSVPPPYYYEYTIDLGPGPSGRIRFVPGYAFSDPPCWEEPFDADLQRWEWLVARVTTPGYLDHDPPPRREPGFVGGSISSIEIVLPTQQVQWHSYGRPVGAMQEVVEAVRSLVPDALWAVLRDRHARYSEEA